MAKKIIVLLIFIITYSSFSQDFSTLWEGHFSYLNIKDVSQGNNRIYAAAENAVFVYDAETSEIIKKISTIDGLSGEVISSIHYSEIYELIVLGYENGLMEVFFEDDNSVLTIVDILDKPTIPPTKKHINHFNEYNGVVYISTDYGISVYDLERLEFGDTYFIGFGGSQIRVKQTTIFNEFIYAACFDGNGLKKALVASNDLIDFQEWNQVQGGNYLAIEAFENKLFGVKGDRRFYELINDSLNELIRYDNPPLDVRVINNYLIITTEDIVFVYNNNFTLLFQILASDTFNAKFTCATSVLDQIYIGTEEFGLFKIQINNILEFEELHPDGPLLNNSFSIKASPNNLWVTFGDYSLTYNPSPNKKRGFSHLKNEEWNNIPFDSVFGARNLNAIAINPFTENHVFISSFNEGLLEVSDDVPTVLHDNTNSGLESLVIPGNPNFVSIRQCASNFDANGVLWTMTARVDRPLKSYDPTSGQWQGYDFLPLIQDGLGGEWGYSNIVIDDFGTKWIGGYNFGLIGFSNSGELKSLRGEDQNMPSNFVTGLAIDNRNQVWIGTTKGLRVVYNTSNFFTDDNLQAQQIIILEDGVPKELLFQQPVSDIEVDGSNNKWVATIGSGAFYFSSDGQQTIFHFTKDNSPLPSNNVIDMSIDDANGTVYIATDKGLVSFLSGGSEISVDFNDAYVFPNPVRPEFNITSEKIKIRGISENTNIKITDIEGNLVAEAQSKTNLKFKGFNLEIDGGTALWNGKNLANNIVASGVYLIMLSDLETFETKVLKIMVVR